MANFQCNNRLYIVLGATSVTNSKQMGGNLILKNARIEKYLFECGYCDAYIPFICIMRPIFPTSSDDDEVPSKEDMENYQKKLENGINASLNIMKAFRKRYFSIYNEKE